MTSFPIKAYRLFSVFLMLLVPGLAGAQGAVEDPPVSEDQPLPEKQFSIMLNGRDLTVQQTGQDSNTYSMPASGQPLDIDPNPYLDPEVIKNDIKRLAQASVEGEDIMFETDEGLEETEAATFEGETLDMLDAAAIGLMTGYSAGLPENLWEGSNAQMLPTLISSLPAGTKSPTVNALRSKLLLAPIEVEVEVGMEPTPQDLLYARLERLHAAGDMQSLMDLFEQITREERSARLTGLMAETYLLDGDFETGCRLAGEGQRAAGSTAFLKLSAICLALESREAEARFNVSLLQETGEADFGYLTLFEEVVKAVRDDQRQLSTPAGFENGEGSSSFFSQDFYLLSGLTPLHVGILKILDRKVELSIDTDEVSNLMLSALARWGNLSLETKLEIADIALERGILRQTFLKELVAAYEFSQAEKENAYLLDYQSWGVKSDALFYALALESFDFPEAIQNIQEGWSRARVAGRGIYMAQLFYETIADIPADPEYVSFAPDAVRIALLAGKNEKANEWYMMVRERAATGNPEATRMLVEMWPLMIVLDEKGEIPYSPQILTLWRRSLELLTPEEQLGRTMLFYEILGILGFEVPENLKTESRLTSGEDFGIGHFIGGGSVGETILLVLGRLGAEDTVNASPETLGNSLFTLDEAGLENQGRHIVLEALIGRGF